MHVCVLCSVCVCVLDAAVPLGSGWFFLRNINHKPRDATASDHQTPDPLDTGARSSHNINTVGPDQHTHLTNLTARLLIFNTIYAII